MTQADMAQSPPSPPNPHSPTNAPARNRVHKALSLVEQGRVTQIPGKVFRVKGDTGFWIVSVSALTVTCNCPYGANKSPDDPSSCSHVIAVSLYARDEATSLAREAHAGEDPFIGLPTA